MSVELDRPPSKNHAKVSLKYVVLVTEFQVLFQSQIDAGMPI